MDNRSRRIAPQFSRPRPRVLATRVGEPYVPITRGTSNGGFARDQSDLLEVFGSHSLFSGTSRAIGCMRRPEQAIAQLSAAATSAGSAWTNGSMLRRMEVRTRISLVWEEPPPPAGSSQVLASFRPYAGHTPLPVIRLVGSYSKLNPAFQALGTEDPQELREAMTAYAITRIEADPDVWKQLNELPEDSPLTISIDDSAVADLAAGFAVKRCDRQVRDRGDLWCDASSANDKTASGQIEGRVVAPTSTPICAACDVPDSRLRCTAFMHPEVTGVRAFGGTHERSLNWAICDAGHQDRITGAPQLCIPESGHECWFRDVTIGPRVTHGFSSIR